MPSGTPSGMPRGVGDSLGPGRLFTLLYGVFAVGATSRSLVQLLTRASHAPLAYGLSAFAACVYVVGFVLLLRWGHPGSRSAMRVLCLVELTGVLVIGTLSVLRRDLFPDATVWSNFGMGYLFLPALLPLAVLRWLRRTDPRAAADGVPAQS
ncbi:MAG: hypothetical protein IPI32_06830 [Austwickia sp.]|nr:hypothetical protein [Austwickia sp.]MBK8437230.1 hypothetical protein [Austwickia sp.]MBK9102464.1 hypothetical protein [Austwickia sp.]